jgi:hypothetical protein
MFRRASMFCGTLFATHYSAYRLGKTNPVKDKPKSDREELSLSTFLSVTFMSLGVTFDEEIMAAMGVLIATHSFAYGLGSNQAKYIEQESENKRYQNSRS